MIIDKKTILWNRMKRQGFLTPIENLDKVDEYLEIFRRLQPVSPIFFTMPGNPPNLVHRTIFDDTNLSSSLRKKNKIIKARFAGGRVGYVLQEDLEVYARAFKKPLKKQNNTQEEIYKYIQNCDGVMKTQIKEDLMIPGPLVSRALKRLQEAFLLYENQVDGDWDTAWFEFATEWFNVEDDIEKDLSAVKKVILTFIKSMYVASIEEIKSWSELNIKIIKEALEELENEEKISTIDSYNNLKSYICIEDFEFKSGDLPNSVYMLDKSDFMVRANMFNLKEKYKGKEILQYLLIDGEFQGAIEGHWRIGPHDIDDVLLDLDYNEVELRKNEIINEIRKYYASDWTKIKKYNGKSID